MSLFDDRDMAAITSPDYPGERLIVCRNLISPASALASARTCWPRPKRTSPHRRGGCAPASRCAAKPRSRSRSAPSQQAQDGQALRPRHRRGELRVPRKTAAIAAEAALDGIYVVRTSLPKKALETPRPSRLQKPRPGGARFPLIKTVDIHLRPIFTGGPIACAPTSSCACSPITSRSHAPGLAPMLYDETDKEAAEAQRSSIVAKAERSAAVKPNKQPAELRTASRSTASAAYSPILPHTAGSRRPPRSTRNTSLPSTPGQPRSRAAPSNSSPSTPTVPSNRHSLSINESEINALQS